MTDFSSVHFLTVAEVAAMMRVSRMTVYRMSSDEPNTQPWRCRQ